VGVYRVQNITKEEFVTNVVQVEMQCRHLYIVCHPTRATIATVTYQAKHEILHNDMV
jgi:hypothetical protein